MESEVLTQKAEYDTPWKEVLEIYFKNFLEICLPFMALLIDWSKGYESLDKELMAITKNSQVGKRIVDKLIRVWKKDGLEAWVLCHVEIQGQPQKNFEERMYIYNYRLFDRYKKPVVSIAVLIDGNKSWKPSFYENIIWGTRVRFDFIMIKLIDYCSEVKALSNSTNPFAMVILTYLEALKARKDVSVRYTAKLRLTKNLYEKGWGKKEIINLYAFIDWVLALPKSLELEYMKEIENLEREKNMRYVTSAERIGIEKGLEKGIAKGIAKGREQGIIEGERTLFLRLLQRKFGSLSAQYQEKIKSANSQELMNWADAVIAANSINEIFRN